MVFKVYLGELAKNNLPIKLKTNNQEISFIASNIPYNSLSELVYALIAILTYKQFTVNVRWSTEPVEYEFCFSVKNKDASLVINKYPDSRRKQGTEEVIFSVTGSPINVALPFWRALRDFQSRPNEISPWIRFFPTKQMARLSETIKLAKEEKNNEFMDF
jgi:hypothetical protein